MEISTSKTLPPHTSPIHDTYDELLTQLSSEEYLVLSFGSYGAAVTASNIIKTRISHLKMQNISLTQRDADIYLRQEVGFTLSEGDKTKLLDKIEKTDDGCWMWKGPQSAGYGVPFIQGRQRLAHRMFYLMHHGVNVEGLRIKNTCGNRGCVNPDHFKAPAIAFRDLQERARYLDVTQAVGGSWNIPAELEESTE